MIPEICSGLRVLDLSRTWTGALATVLLADAGAEVIKIEAPGGDPTWSHYASPMWHRGKKSAFLDLKTPDGQDTLKRLAANSDVLLHTLMPGAAERLGADYETLRAVNPALVYCSVSGFGPLKGLEHVKGYDAIVAAHTGRFHVFDKQIDRDGPKFAALPVASFGAGMLALQGIFSALLVREQTGRGQKVETSLLQSLIIAYDWLWLLWQLKNRGDNPTLGWSETEPTPQYFVSSHQGRSVAPDGQRYGAPILQLDYRHRLGRLPCRLPLFPLPQHRVQRGRRRALPAHVRPDEGAPPGRLDPHLS